MEGIDGGEWKKAASRVAPIVAAAERAASLADEIRGEIARLRTLMTAARIPGGDVMAPHIRFRLPGLTSELAGMLYLAKRDMADALLAKNGHYHSPIGKLVNPVKLDRVAAMGIDDERPADLNQALDMFSRNLLALDLDQLASALDMATARMASGVSPASIRQASVAYSKLASAAYRAVQLKRLSDYIHSVIRAKN